ncbi:MAG: potassium channel family protein, partial [Bacteroidota bacterium]
MLDSLLHDSLSLRYQVEIFDKQFRSFSKYVVISFFDDAQKKIEEFKFGFITNEEIFQMIDEGKDVNLNGAFVKNFSLMDYRVEKGMDDSVPVKLNNFSAKKAFFEADIKTDFSFAEFVGSKTIFEACIFGNGGADFNNSDFGEGDAIFKKAKFGTGNISFQFAKFGSGIINYNGVCFGNGNVNFVSTDFGNGNVDFKNTLWGDGTVDFKFGKFSDGDITFEKASFGNGKKDFKNLEFGGGKIDFKRVSFNDGDVSFNGVEFGKGKVSFRSSSFGTGEITFEETDFGEGEVQFDQVDFGDGKVSFNQARGQDFSFTGCPLNAYFDFRFANCNKVDLSNTVVRDILDMMPSDEKVHIKLMQINGMRILGRIFIDWKRNDVHNLIYLQKNTTLEQKAEQFRILKENFRNNGQYNDEDSCYLEFKRCESKAHLEEAKNKGGLETISGYVVYYFQTYVFDFIGRYATNPIRVLFNMSLAYLIFSFIYFIFSITNGLENYGHVVAGGAECKYLHDLPWYSAFGNSMYFSGITFMTVGYGDYFAGGVLKPVAVVEGFTGVFFMSYFTVAFVR